jgi:D-sedoheptulose 7-phosphate isomerase
MNIDEIIKTKKANIDCLKEIEISLVTVAQILADSLQNGRKILISGNGGSAADAQHFSAELIGRFEKERQSYPAIALTTDSSAVTAIANDYGFENIFSRQIEGLGISGDVFVGITTSGNSENILKAFTAAKNKQIKTVLFSGKTGGRAKELADYSILVPLERTADIQEIHQICYHEICRYIDNE